MDTYVYTASQVENTRLKIYSGKPHKNIPSFYMPGGKSDTVESNVTCGPRSSKTCLLTSTDEAAVTWPLLIAVKHSCIDCNRYLIYKMNYHTPRTLCF